MLEICPINLFPFKAKSYAMIEKKFNNKVISKLNKRYVIKSKKIEEKIQETKKAINDKNIDVIVNPVFGFEYKNNLIVAQSKIFIKSNNKISFLKISTSTKIKDILRFIFDYLVLKELNIQVNDVSLFIIKTKDYKKGEVDFYETQYVNTVKNGRSLKGKAKYDSYFQQLEKSGESKESQSIIEILKAGKISKKNKNILFNDLLFYLNKIIESKSINKIVNPTDEDCSIYDDNKDWDEILNANQSPWKNFSGNLIPKKSIVKNKDILELKSQSTTLNKLLENKIIIQDQNKVLEIIKKLEQKVVWYDFEAIALPFAPIDHFMPFSQVVSQVSIIRTNKLKEIEINNLIADPKNIGLQDFENIINAIYVHDHKYVVYNKSYENTRLKEMIYILKKKSYPLAKELAAKVRKIINNTIDLADFFICHKNKMPLILIPQLRGKHSIKIIEKYITNESISLPYKIKEYKNLDIKSGIKAMESANNRALGIIGDSKWNIIQELLKEYCENDVRAMILVFYLVKNYIYNN